MAIEISGARTPAKKRSRAPEAIIGSLIGAALIGGIAAFAMGMDDYSQMRDMQLTWTEIRDIADSEDPEEPQEYYEMTPSGDAANAGGGLVLEGTLTKAEDRRETDMLYRAINLPALKAANPDVSGYVHIPNTAVDYPILKERVPEEYFYLDHDMNGNYDRYGSIFELCDEERGGNVATNAVEVVFGHNMRSGAMFAGITNYRNAAYADNPVYVYRDGYRIEYKAFATCVVDAHDAVYDFDGFRLGTDEYAALLEWLDAKDEIGYGMAPPDRDTPILVLSTCNDATSDVRIIVCLAEARKAVTPEYYETLQEIGQYGGDPEGEEKPQETAANALDDYWDEIRDAESHISQGMIIGR